jgi:hypothetical protein
LQENESNEFGVAAIGVIYIQKFVKIGKLIKVEEETQRNMHTHTHTHTHHDNFTFSIRKESRLEEKVYLKYLQTKLGMDRT